MSIIFLDYETYSETPIKYGVHKYAEDAEIMIATYAVDDGPVQAVDYTALPAGYSTPLEALINHPGNTIVIQNSGFDRIVAKHARGINMPVERIHDTMVQALAHGLPGGLGALCDVLGIPTDQAKDKRGRELINLFCKPRPKNMKLRRATRETNPTEWQQFIEYAKADITAMRAIYHKLPTWNYRDGELALWQLDQRINDRGVCVDTELARAAIAAVEQAQSGLAVRTCDATGGEVESATRRDALLRYILNTYGIQLPDMQASTLERRINDPDLPEGVRDLLAIRLQTCTTSTAKYQTLINAVSADGRLRGTLQFCGASRTGRWSGRTFQPQNLPRPKLKQKIIDHGIEALKLGCADLVFENVMELTSAAIRGCIIAPEGKKLVVSDLSNIEGRAAAWIAGEEWKLQAFRDFDAGTGHDLYKLAYARSFGVLADTVDKDQRQLGKVQELALGYEGGVGAFVTFVMTYRMDLDKLTEGAISSIPADVLAEAESAYQWAVKQKRTMDLPQRTWVVCDSLKRMWRRAHPAISSYWKELENDAIRAVLNPGTTVVSRKLKLRRDGGWLRIVLPSGRALCYPGPKVEDGKLSYMGTNQYSRKWSRLQTYGGKLFENVCQAVARDVMADNMPLIERGGYAIVLSVHDELITEAPEGRYWDARHLSSLLATVPSWATGMPLAAGGFEAYRYKKE